MIYGICRCPSLRLFSNIIGLIYWPVCGDLIRATQKTKQYQNQIKYIGACSVRLLISSSDQVQVQPAAFLAWLCAPTGHSWQFSRVGRQREIMSLPLHSQSRLDVWAVCPEKMSCMCEPQLHLLNEVLHC